jgi:hypothetical protein
MVFSLSQVAAKMSTKNQQLVLGDAKLLKISELKRGYEMLLLP